jgi:hypothetical protein
MVTRSDEQADLAAALAKAQAAIRSAEKDRSNPHLRNKYATLQSVIIATRKPLGDHGLSLTCAPVFEDGKAGVCWTLRHSSGQYESGVLLMPLGQARGVNPSQQCGAVISYASRYVRMHLLACAAGDDTDAAHESDRAPTRQRDQPTRHQPSKRGQPIRDQSAEEGPKVDTKSNAWRAWQVRLGDGHPALKYNHLAAWCEANKRPRPSAMTVHQWRQLQQWIDNGGRAVVAKWSPDAA